MATYTIPKITPSVFNSSDYIDTSFLTKKEADDLYINELPESVEKLIGNINIIGEETVSSQVVTGNCLINGNLTTGQDGFNGTTASTTIIKGNPIQIGTAGASVNSYIYGNVTLGDQNNGGKVYMLGENIIGLTKPTKINGQVLINTDDTWGSDTIIGKTGNTLKSTTINGIVKLGDQNNVSTHVEALGKLNLGWAQLVSINSSNTNINIEPHCGTTTIGNGSNTLNVNTSTCSINTNTGSTACNIGRASSAHTTSIQGNVNIGQAGSNATNITNIYGTVNLGDSSGNGNIAVKCPINSTSTITAGKALDINSGSTIAGNVTLGDTGWGTQVTLNGQVACGSNTGKVVIAGGPTEINVGLASGNVQIGRAGLTSGGQENTFLSGENRIFNPKLCDANGAITSQNFNLNSPCCAVFSAGTRYVGSSVTLPSTATRTVYLNVPDLTSTITYPIILDFSHFVFGGFPTTNTPVSTVLVGYNTANSTAIASGESRSKSLACNMVLCVAKASSSSIHNYYFLPNINTTTNPFSSTSIKLKVNNAVTTYNYTPFTISKVSETKLKIDVKFPQSSTTWSVNGANATSANNEFVYSLGFTIRLQTSPASNSSVGLFPNNSTDSPAGSCWLSLS
jgi:hypothetical protein